MHATVLPRYLSGALVLLLALPGTLAAQSERNATVRGVVNAAESGELLGFTVVTLYPSGGRRFTDARGAFAFAVAPGRYVLSARQIGYAPLDTQVVLAGDSAVDLRLVLHRLAIELPPVTVAAQQCTTPGPPGADDIPLRAVFEQLQENARRYELLADSYPFRYTLEISDRSVSQRGDTGRPTTSKLEFLSRDEPSYAPGGVVGPSYPPWQAGALVIETGDLAYFANPSFIANHCFRLVGRDTIAGETLVRIDFEPDTRIWSADLSGAAFLDSLTFQLRYIETSLTHPERTDLKGVKSMTARTRFRDIAAGVPLQDSMVAVTIYRFRRSHDVQTQRTLDVRFLRRRPAP